MFSWFRTGFFLIAYIVTIILCVDDIKLGLNFNEDFKYTEYDPFVMLVSGKNRAYKVLPIEISDDGTALFRPQESYRLVLACPAKTEKEIDKSEKDNTSFLFENELGTDLFCRDPLKPYVQVGKKENGDDCGKNGEGLSYFIGYPVEIIDHESEGKPWIFNFVYLHEICYSEEKGVIFTMHSLHPTLGSNKNEISQDQLEKLKLHRVRTDINMNEIYKNRKSDEKVYQFVPYNDMELIPWKNATLLDIKTILVNDVVKKQLDTINHILRNLSNDIGSFKVYSGVTDISSDSKWYWKVIRRQWKNEWQALAILLFHSQSKSNKPISPCENNKETCKRSNLHALEKDIPNLFCCLVDKTLAIQIGLVTKNDNNEIVYPTAKLPVIFPAKILPQKTHYFPKHIRGIFGGSVGHGHGHGISHGSDHGNNQDSDAGLAGLVTVTAAASYSDSMGNNDGGGDGGGA